MELGSIDLLVEFAKLGFGTAFVTRSLIQQELEAGELFELTLTSPIAPRELGLAVRKNAATSLAATAFLDRLGVKI